MEFVDHEIAFLFFLQQVDDEFESVFPGYFLFERENVLRRE